MDHNLASVLKLALVSATFLSAFAILVLGLRRPARKDNQQTDLIAGRLDRIEQAVDTIAIEVERISEGQRFTSKLLAEKDAPAKVAARQVTPH